MDARSSGGLATADELDTDTIDDPAGEPRPIYAAAALVELIPVDPAQRLEGKAFDALDKPDDRPGHTGLAL
jgi:hypothetical protein